jgi:hypothetical protein
MAHSSNFEATVDSVAAEVDTAVMAGLRATIAPMVALVKDANTKYAVMESILSELPMHRTLKHQHATAQARLAEIDANVTVEVSEINSACPHIETDRSTVGSLHGFIEQAISNENSQDAINAYLAIAEFINSGPAVTHLEDESGIKTSLFQYLDTIRVFEEPHIGLTVARWYADVAIPIPWDRLGSLSAEWQATRSNYSCSESGSEGELIEEEVVGRDGLAKTELVESEKELVESEKELVESEKELVESEKELVESEKELVESEEEPVESEEELVESEEEPIESVEGLAEVEEELAEVEEELFETREEHIATEMSCDECEEPSDHESDDGFIAYEGLQDEHGDILETYLDPKTQEVFDIQDSGTGDEYVLIGTIIDGEFVDADE